MTLCSVLWICQSADTGASEPRCRTGGRELAACTHSRYNRKSLRPDFSADREVMRMPHCAALYHLVFHKVGKNWVGAQRSSLHVARPHETGTRECEHL